MNVFFFVFSFLVVAVPLNCDTAPLTAHVVLSFPLSKSLQSFYDHVCGFFTFFTTNGPQMLLPHLDNRSFSCSASVLWRANAGLIIPLFHLPWLLEKSNKYLLVGQNIPLPQTTKLGKCGSVAKLLLAVVVSTRNVLHRLQLSS